ncbi:MAG: TraR/DksA family transcriptional regulator [Pseudomonadota bacterium]|jgi:RNA polymerase-binding transcription factor DksA|nr:dimethylmenaquinone methyltransferase [Rhodovulum sp.]MCI5086198.1 TraR/DksA family transcriptional regulator [Rhodovulum sp.]MEC8628779.1 TraR/DksA family transcriptional regulator [Pseudomonadota bacterium]MEE3317763.1 TraR/DksA family transcriptional regulator [Pseudomonadota bacterium]|tara:strand:+ start:458 stop:775 length:318 start_codon:yes stop_codon:yes gene_type:complete
MIDLAQRKKALIARLRELDTRLHSIEDELDSHQAKDWEDLATEREEDEVLERIGVDGIAEIERIRNALARIDDGTYGVCVTCGDEISAKRLDILPATPFCATCAS